MPIITQYAYLKRTICITQRDQDLSDCVSKSGAKTFPGQYIFPEYEMI